MLQHYGEVLDSSRWEQFLNYVLFVIHVKTANISCMAVKMTSVSIDGVVYPVTITYKRVKNVNLRVNGEGDILVSLPYGVPVHVADSFLNEKKEWIVRALGKVQKKTDLIHLGDGDDYVYYYGKKYFLEVKCVYEEKLVEEGDKLVLHTPYRDSEDIMMAFYRLAGDGFKAIVRKQAVRLNKMVCDKNHLVHPSITIKYMISRWGSCTPMKHHISLSCRLIHYPEECTAYVMVHEYAHLLVPNHSKAFYDVVRQYMPDYDVYRKMLK